MLSATMTSKGQITLPKEIRKALGIKAGDRVSFQFRDDGTIEMRPEMLDLMSLCGVLKPKVQGVTLADMEQAIVAGATCK